MNLRKANAEKNDEFYTQLSDIEKELAHYKQHFKDKVIYCNCDDPRYSAFWKYFHLNFTELGLKKLISTYYNKNVFTGKLFSLGTEVTYKSVYEGGNDADITVYNKTQLKGNGDFRSKECVEILKEANIIVTNPPFSIARQLYLPLLFRYNKQFLIVGDLNWVCYQNIFKLLQNSDMWVGNSYISGFLQPDSTFKNFGNKLWFTNLNHSNQCKGIELHKKYEEGHYQKFDNYNAINVDKISDIPVNYNGLIGVPITFMNKYNPEQFEIVDALHRYSLLDLCKTNTYIQKHHLEATNINGKSKYFRIIIRKRKN